eukprot:SAG31_NODE_18119_length_646_cov_1.053016_1_plen_143_part_10
MYREGHRRRRPAAGTDRRMASKKRAADVPVDKLDEKNTMRNEDHDEDRFGPPVKAGFGIQKGVPLDVPLDVLDRVFCAAREILRRRTWMVVASEAVLAGRKIVKGKRSSKPQAGLESIAPRQTRNQDAQPSAPLPCLFLSSPN